MWPSGLHSLYSSALAWKCAVTFGSKPVRCAWWRVVVVIFSRFIVSGTNETWCRKKRRSFEQSGRGLDEPLHIAAGAVIEQGVQAGGQVMQVMGHFAEGLGL